jgi:hypothetical protein
VARGPRISTFGVGVAIPNAPLIPRVSPPIKPAIPFGASVVGKFGGVYCIQCHQLSHTSILVSFGWYAMI